MSIGRILAVDDDALFLRVLEEHLSDVGFELIPVREATKAVPLAMSKRPDLILIDRTMPILTGPELLRALRAFPKTAGIPVAYLTADVTESTLLHAIRSGVVDVLHKLDGPDRLVRDISALMDRVQRTRPLGPPTPDSQVRVLLSIYRRQRRDGVLRLNPGTPFEGRAYFDGGALRSAEFNGATGLTALEEMIALDGGHWRFEEEWPDEITDRDDPAGPPAAGEVRHLAGEAPIRLLLVDDDPDLRRLFQVQLERAGFAVDVAEDGREGVQLARARDYDLMIADLNMPRLDGWGMLRELRADFRTRELPVIFLSAHDDYRETLRVANSGAWDYLPKTGHVDLVVQRTLQALLPRQRVNAELLMGGPVDVELGVVGPRWMLRTLASHRATGVLRAKDDWASYRFAMREGAPVSARVTAGGQTSTGISALGALLLSSGAEATFIPCPVEEPATFEHAIDPLLDLACTALNELEARAVSQRIEQGGRIEVDPELYALYRRVSSDRDLMIARALCEQKLPAHELAGQLSLPPEEIEAGLTDLLRRRVIRFV